MNRTHQSDPQGKLPQVPTSTKPGQASSSLPPLISGDPDKRPIEARPVPTLHFNGITINPNCVAREGEVYRPPPYPYHMAYPYHLPFMAPPPVSIPPYHQYPYQPIPVRRPIPQLPIFSQVTAPTPMQRLPQESPQPSRPSSSLLPTRPEPGPPPKEESKGSTKTAKPSSGGAYKRRNVYKSIIRHMYSYIRKHRDEIIKVLQGAGYSMSEIEHTFFEISCYNDAEQQKGNKKQSQATIKKMIDEISIYTYILRETLNSMIKSWDEGKHGKVSAKNLATYRDVCITYYNEAVKALEQKAQGKSFHL